MKTTDLNHPNHLTRMKILGATLTYFTLMLAARAAGLADLANATPETDVQAGILTAMFKQVLNNPSSSIFVPALCVIGWLVDDLPFINSRYVAHIMIVMGACTFRFFCLESAVPKYFPHPQAVFILNGIIAGFIAFVLHKQVVARAINFFRAQGGPEPRTIENKTP